MAAAIRSIATTSTQQPVRLPECTDAVGILQSISRTDGEPVAILATKAGNLQVEVTEELAEKVQGWTGCKIVISRIAGKLYSWRCD